MRSCPVILVCAIAVCVGGARPAYAGPPLVCHPFETGGAPSLPWAGGPGWNTPDPSYDTRKLTVDTMRLLAAEKRILPRMETLRRATIYASADPRLAYELLSTMLGRALSAAAVGRPDELAWFDAGYLVETYKQASAIQSLGAANENAGGSSLRDQLNALDGYGWTRRALELSGGDADMELAASLMRTGPASEEHRRRAQAGARAGSLLARALAATEPVPARKP